MESSESKQPKGGMLGKLPPRYAEIIRFGIVGVAATVVQYAIYYVLVYVGVNAYVALTLGYAISFIGNFFLSNYFTFKTKPSVKKGIGFGLSHAVNYGLQMLLLPCFIYLGIPERFALIPVFAIAIPVNFILVRTVLKSKKL